MTEATSHEGRKEAQLHSCLSNDIRGHGITTGFERYRFVHQALPELDWREIDLGMVLLGKPLRAPVLISAMTGGCRLGAEINRNLATAAQRLGLGMGVGSQRAAILDPGLIPSYQVRQYAPDILLLGNLGAVQLNKGFGLSQCRQAIEMISADGLCLHLNGLQELQQASGDHDCRGILEKIGIICDRLGSPVVVKEVGWGMSGDVAASLASAGVSALDVAGAGGSSWYVAERLAAGETRAEIIESPFASWGIPTVESLSQTTESTSSLPIIASGGIRNGVDAAKAIALGASAVAVAHPLLRPATESADAVVAWLERFILELRTAMFCIGAADLKSLRQTRHLVEAA
ncbi:MAG TPA: type 2 isopentenyl-diphosphate Delta-isomerase [Chloroflexota bacterium]|nr:type 2 isopentenyl-diphosphate Delta-isomerase [Chloroflexota bacterium]